MRSLRLEALLFQSGYPTVISRSPGRSSMVVIAVRGT
jgi:hypothetical protein